MKKIFEKIMEKIEDENALIKFVIKVEKIYNLLEWEWSGKGIPTKLDIIKRLISLKEELLESDDSTISIGTGGLFAVKEYLEEDGDEYNVAYHFRISETMYATEYNHNK